MQDISEPLSDDELDYLYRCLLDRFDEDVDTQDKDEGILNISELDGFFTAIVSGPGTIFPSQWFPGVWGEIEPEWKNQKQFEKVMSLMLRHMNCIAAILMEKPENFFPLFYEREVKDNTYIVVDEWCEGFGRGVMLAEEEWIKGGIEMEILLAPILAFTPITNWRGHEFKDDKIENIQHAITPNVRDIHAFWLARRENENTASRPKRRGASRVGRNDLCPCGSGKKYKKCCLH